MTTWNMANPCLYIIGNGLDRFHDHPTSYSNFGNYIKAHDKEFYDNLSNWYPTFIDNQHKGVFSLWTDFENGLKEIDQDLLWQYINDNLVQYGAEDWKDEDNHRVQYVIQNLVDSLTNKLKQHLVNWICLVNVLATSKRLRLEADAIYFTFNYTKKSTNTITTVEAASIAALFFLSCHISDIFSLNESFLGTSIFSSAS